MSFVPAYEVGLWNTWIFMLYFPLHGILMLLIDRLVVVGDIMKKMVTPHPSKTEKRIGDG